MSRPVGGQTKGSPLVGQLRKLASRFDSCPGNVEFYHKGGWTTSSPWQKESEVAAPVLSRGIPGRAYVWPPGVTPPEYSVPSVTTIINEYAKSWLGPWMSKAAAQFTADNLDELIALPRDAVFDVVNRASRRISESAMGKGTKVHEAVEAFIGGDPVNVEDMDRLPQIGAAFDFLETHVEKVLHSEVTFFNLTYQYAGTADLVVVLKTAPYKGKTALVDLKTGKRLYKEVALQLSALANGEFMVDDNLAAADMPTFDLGMAVHLTDEGKYSAKPVKIGPEVFKAFVALRSMAKYRAFIEPDVFGKALKGSDVKVTPDGEE